MEMSLCQPSLGVCAATFYLLALGSVSGTASGQWYGLGRSSLNFTRTVSGLVQKGEGCFSSPELKIDPILGLFGVQN